MEESIDLTTDAELMELHPDKKVEFTLYVVRVDQTIKTKVGKLLFKFLLSNTTGTTVHVAAWDDDIPRAQKVVQLYNILHLENLNYRSATKYNEGNFHAEFAIHKFSVIEYLSKYEIVPQPIKEEDYPLIELHSLGDQLLPLKFKIIGYLKTDLHVSKSENEALTKAFFVITDGEFKLDVTVHSYKEELVIDKGSKLVVIGSAQFFQSNQMYLRVEGANAIRIVADEPKKPLNWLLKGKKLINSKYYGGNPSKKQKTL